MSFYSQVKKTFKNIKQDYSVTWSVNTETVNPITGQATNSFATATVLDCIFLRKNSDVVLAEQGIVMETEAYLILPYNSTVSSNDKIIVTFSDSSTETYTVRNVIVRGKKYKYAGLRNYGN